MAEIYNYLTKKEELALTSCPSHSSFNLLYFTFTNYFCLSNLQVMAFYIAYSV